MENLVSFSTPWRPQAGIPPPMTCALEHVSTSVVAPKEGIRGRSSQVDFSTPSFPGAFWYFETSLFSSRLKKICCVVRVLKVDCDLKRVFCRGCPLPMPVPIVLPESVTTKIFSSSIRNGSSSSISKCGYRSPDWIWLDSRRVECPHRHAAY